jgi:hypothetical protein
MTPIREKLFARRNTYSSAILSTADLTWTVLGLNPGLRTFFLILYELHKLIVQPVVLNAVQVCV